ncbi:unnamed protein product [Rangifer tarandus platyrhynchus]|uniref:Uncharacterized protein n=2 Tax=Rangifer tarandus platyrhynchus TaxID=3082113 RepID=A0ABN8Y8S5_RANTA|nr:unnamed protein product [Rangifer tarandus platyrhynchus]CAI9695077.1 unnamed protein product [Rangifer tarandus platyrhynchus]
MELRVIPAVPSPATTAATPAAANAALEAPPPWLQPVPVPPPRSRARAHDPRRLTNGARSCGRWRLRGQLVLTPRQCGGFRNSAPA